MSALDSVGVGEFQSVLPNGLEVTSLLHPGGQRRVFAAVEADEELVVKLMPADDRNRAEREVAIGQSFDHPNLPRIVDTELQEAEIASEEFVWFRERRVPGEPLSKRTDTIEPCASLRLAADLVAAVGYLWRQYEVVHRDIKPLNIICCPDGSHVLIDVGIGRHQGKTTITSGALGPGTEGYVAPEQYIPNKGRDLDVRTDLFQIGVVVFEALIGDLPFRTDDPDYYAKLTSGTWPRPTGLPEAILGLLERLLAPHPHQRPSLGRAETLVSETREEIGCS